MRTQKPRPRRLCMLVHGPYPRGEPRVEQEAVVALRAGFEVDVIASRRRGELRTETVGGVAVTRLPVKHFRGRGFVFSALEYAAFTAAAFAVLARRCSRYSVVQIHNPPDFLVAAAAIPRLRGARLILDVHDLAPELYATRFPGGRRFPIKLLELVERMATRFVDAVVTVHEPYRRELEQRGVPSSKLTIVMNVVDPELLPPRIAPLSGVFRIVYHGTITPSYGVELIVEAAAALRGDIEKLEIELVGEGDALPSVLRRAEELGIREIVIADGTTVSRREALRRAASASVGIIPNLPTPINRFALPTKLFEYVALGVPVVSAALPAIEEYFSANELTYFSSGDSADAARALVSVASDPEAARKRTIAAKRRIGEYAWGTSAERYGELLTGLTTEIH